MKNFWNHWPTPWSRSQCRDRYVRGDRIGLRQLAADSGQPQKTVERWCKADSWAEQRHQFQQRVAAKVDEKVAENISENLGVELARLAEEHFQSYDLMAKLALRFFRLWNLKFDEIPTEDEQRKLIGSISPVALAQWSLTLDRAIKGQRLASGLEYEDLNKAIAKVRSAGYEVSDGDSASPEN